MNWLRTLHDIPLGRKLTLSILGTSILSVLTVSIIVLIYSVINERQEMQNELAAMARMVGDNSSAALAFGDEYAARETLYALKVRSSIEVACLYHAQDENYQLFADYRASSRGCPTSPLSQSSIHINDGLAINLPINLQGSTIGLIHLQQNFDDLWEVIRLYIIAIILSVLVALVIAWLLTLNLKAWLSAPVLELTSTANRISETGDYSLRVNNYGEDEVGQLIHRFNSMLAQIERQNLELVGSRQHLEERVQARTAEIEQAMGSLKSAQQQLIQTEKLAALGGLVAGVAHEINTPVGVGMTASSSLYDHSREVLAALGSNQLTKSELVDYVENAMEATDIILKNLSRAADLVRSFKQVAIDQSGLERRSINLEEYIQSILTSLHPEMKKTSLAVNVDCPDDLIMETYPGALSQIITNLVMNSITHAFEPGEDGEIRIHVLESGEDVCIQYSDNGKGIAPEYLPHVFEPFFTTRRNEGGSGLGMHIVHNIVTQTLNGSVQLTSDPGEGIRVILKVPMKLARAESTDDEPARQINAT